MRGHCPPLFVPSCKEAWGALSVEGQRLSLPALASLYIVTWAGEDA